MKDAPSGGTGGDGPSGPDLDFDAKLYAAFSRLVKYHRADFCKQFRVLARETLIVRLRIPDEANPAATALLQSRALRLGMFDRYGGKWHKP
jgi:hypothetical protein